MNRDPAGESPKKHIIDACVQFSKSKGYSDACGVLRGTLYLADEPLSLDQLADETGYSKSTVCLNMNLMENLGIARRIIVPGDKRSRYIIITDPNSMKSALLTNIKKEVQAILNALDLTEMDLAANSAYSGKVKAKIESLRRFYRQIDELLDLVDKFSTEELIELLSKAKPNEQLGDQ